MNIQELAEKHFKSDSQQEPGKLPGRISTNEQERQRLQELTGIMAENNKKSSGLRVAINKGIHEGTSDKDLLLMALECIAAMTGDRVFLQNVERIRERRPC